VGKERVANFELIGLTSKVPKDIFWVLRVGWFSCDCKSQKDDRESGRRGQGKFKWGPT